MTLLSLIGQNPPPIALWVQSSETDRVSSPSTRRLLQVARAPLSVRAVVEKHAGHRLGVWAALLPTALRWLGSHEPGFAAR